MKTLFLLLFLILGLEASNKCLKCHQGIEDIRDRSSDMMKEIIKVADKSGYEGNDCIVCHGGNPNTTSKKRAHKGTIKYFKTHKGPKEFYPSPTSAYINENTCGMCHEKQVSTQMNSLMNTEQGKIQGAIWSFARNDGYKHNIGNFKTQNPKDIHKRLGTKSYKTYMQQLSKLEPQAFPNDMEVLPKAPTADEVEKDPSLAVYTYLRQECLRCHTSSKGRLRRGDFRGVGCASCHIPYSNTGLYEGKDKTISKKEPGHLLSHQIQSSRDTKIEINDHNYSGIPVETCTTCHNRGKRIGVSYQGLMESAYNSTYDEKGNGQTKLHTKRYLHMKEDIHFKKGMLCQDCHTSNDMHGDGFLTGANLAAVEIECQDCHGTTKKYPWELPLGYSDEFSTKVKVGKARGLTKTLIDYLNQGSVDKPNDGYLLTTRGNPLVHTAKNPDNSVTIHLASGKDIKLKPLKLLKEKEKLSPNALLAMDKIDSHTDNLECYTCHATWAPQCYGCHVKIDYSGGKKNIDYLKASHDNDIHGTTGGMRDLKKYLVDGKVTETRSFLRWEDPMLSQNGEGRISPTIPGCQTTITVIGKDGNTLLQNHIFKQKPGIEHGGEEGQNSIDMSPVQPHTISKESRSCESCHTSKKALGYGIGSLAPMDQDVIVDLMDINGTTLSKNAIIQINAINNLKTDYTRIQDENGTQLMTVGHHFKLSQPLSKEQIDKVDRQGSCIACHKSIPEKDLAVSVLTHIADVAKIKIDKKEHGNILSKVLLLSAWVQVTIGSIIILFIVYFIFFRKKKHKKGW